MIRTDEELELTRKQLDRVERALKSLRDDVRPKSPERFELMAESYFDQIRDLRTQIDGYLLGRELVLESESEIEIGLEGQGVRLGEIPSSLVTSVLDQFRRGLQSLFETRGTDQSRRGGRRQRWMEVLSDPPLVALQPGSVRVHLGAPQLDELFSEPDFQETLNLLTKGIAWASKADNTDVSMSELEGEHILRHVLLNVVKNLTPARGSRVEAVYFGGRMMGTNGTLRLTKSSRQRITKALKELVHVEEYAEIEGVIRELDLDKKTFTLRQRHDGGEDLPCNYDLALEDDVIYCLDQRVLVAGSLRTNPKNRQQTMDVEFLEASDATEQNLDEQ